MSLPEIHCSQVIGGIRKTSVEVKCFLKVVGGLIHVLLLESEIALKKEFLEPHLFAFITSGDDSENKK